MIKNLIITGCSFSEINNAGIPTWADYVSQHVSAEYYVNLAKSGAGNFFIADSLIQCLLTEKFDPAVTLVLVMWSGPGRKDITVSEDFYSLLPEHRRMARYGTYYAYSGGITRAGAPPVLTSTWDALYKLSDRKTMSHDTLRHMVNTRIFLEHHGYHYKFMSYVNYWQSCPDYVSKGLDFSIQYHNESDPLLNMLGDQWIWADSGKTCLYEYARNNSLFSPDDFHPNTHAHQQWAEKFVIPNLESILQ
jgi:hypothetical protein